MIPVAEFRRIRSENESGLVKRNLADTEEQLQSLLNPEEVSQEYTELLINSDMKYEIDELDLR